MKEKAGNTNRRYYKNRRLQKIEEKMARIKEFVTPTNNRKRNLEFESKIKAHRRGRAFKIVSIAVACALFVAAILYLWSNAVYTSYAEISSFPKTSSSNSTHVNHNGRIITYSKDGISSVDTKGNIIWNETYQMQNPIVEVNENAVAVGDYGGHIVFVMDEKGQYVLTLLEGALAGAGDWCMQFAQLVNAVGVVTGRSREEELFSLDAFAHKNRLHIQDVYRINAIKEKLKAGEKIGIYSDYPIEGVLPEGFVPVGEMAGRNVERLPVPEVGIAVTDDWEAAHFAKECRLYPKNLVMAVYCDRGKTAEELDLFIGSALTEAHLSRERICAVFSIEEKAQEQGILELAERMEIPFFTYTSRQLAGSRMQRKDVTSGLPLSVLCDRCAILGSGQGSLKVAHKMADGMMISVGEQNVELTFQI